MAFVHLHNHSEYSLLNGAIRVSDLVKKSKEYGMSAVAMTDYGNMFGAVEFFLECKKNGIKPIVGATLYHPSNDNHLLRNHRKGIDSLFQVVVLVENKIGYLNLCKIMTKSYLEGFYYKPRIDFALLESHAEGLIVLSGGWDSALNHHLDTDQFDKASQWAQKYAAIFKDRYYIELQDNGVEGQKEMNAKLAKLAASLHLPLVATNNCHYVYPDDAEAFETLMCIQTGATLHGARDHLKYSTDGYYLKKPEEMIDAFATYPDAIENTEKIAAQCLFEFDLKNYYFPKFTPPDGKTLDEFLREEAIKGMEYRWPQIVKARRFDSNDPAMTETISECRKKYDDRLILELNMIQKMGFSGYFLIVSDFIRHAKSQDIPVGPGRGSAAGSLVAYCVQITDIDPLPYNLLFERFLNPERVSMPDVDIDFCMNQRSKVLEYVSQKYGNVSQIITFGKMKAKAVLRDVGRVMDLPYSEVDKIAKLVPNALNITLKEALEQEPRLQELADNEPQIGRLIKVALKLEGLNRHASVHAAGVVISDQPLSNYVPLFKGGNDDIVTQFDMKSVEKIGLIKFDFLGLKTLTVIHDALKIIKTTKGIDINILEIPIDDPAVYELLSKGDTAGVFQLESAGMKDLLVRMKPSCFEDLVALVALYRPGPLGSGMVDDFINRKQGKTPIIYDLPELKGILEDTYGVIVYQEQVMQISSALAGYTLGDADILRRAMGKKNAQEMVAQRERFLKGAKEKNFPTDKAEHIFDLMAKFAEYGFNKSHSAAYAFVSYQTAYLKAHYPTAYLAAITTSEMGDTDRVLYYKQDMELHGIKLLPPDINESYWAFSVISDKEIRYGMGALKGVGEGAIEAIVEARQKIGRFESFMHFANHVDFKRVNKRVVESVIKSGGFDTLEPNRALLFASIEQAMSHAAAKQKEESIGQSSLFGLMDDADKKPIGFDLQNVPEWLDNEKLAYEKEAMGFYFSGHPLRTYESMIRQVAKHDTKLCRSLHNEADAILAGVIVTSRVITTKKGARMAFATLEDLVGSIEIILFPETFKKYGEIIATDKPLVVKGKADRSEEGTKILVDEINLLTEHLSRRAKNMRIKVNSSLINEERLKEMKQILSVNQGDCSLYLHVLSDGAKETVLKMPAGIKLDDNETVTGKLNQLFRGKVVELEF